MKRETATALMDAMAGLDPAFNELTKLTYQIEDETERKTVRRHIAEAMHLMGYEMVMHIVRQYPDLDPDKKA